MQASFLPSEPPHIPGWQFAARLIPARQASGDFYDFISLPGGNWGIVMADVTEAHDEERALFGEDRLLESVRTYLGTVASQKLSAQEMLDAVLADVHSFVGEAPRSDDITVAVVSRDAEAGWPGGTGGF